jgi:hypothetical protein
MEKVMEQFIEYAPLIIIIVTFLLKNKIFVTPEQLEEKLKNREKMCEEDCQKHYVTKAEMQIERRKLMDEVRREFLEKVAFEQFTKGLDEKFDFIGQMMQTVVDNQEYIKNHIIRRGD